MSETGGLILVTGANGFIGSHLVEGLLARGYRVRCMVRCSSNLANIQNLPVEWAYADIRDTESLYRACDGVEAVCHSAALTRALDEKTFMQVNAESVERLARICLEVNGSLKRFLFVSSLAAAGPSRGPENLVVESDPARPVTWYGKSKLAAEQALLCLSREAGGRMPLTIVRPTPVFGPRDKDFLAYFRLIKLGLNLQLGHGERRASLIYVRDLVELLLLALEQCRAVGQIYFASAWPSTYGELAATIAEVMGKRPVRITVPVALLRPMALWSRVQGRLTGRPVLLNDQRLIDLRKRNWLCSGDKAQRELGFVPRYDLITAVRETAHWYREQGWL